MLRRYVSRCDMNWKERIKGVIQEYTGRGALTRNYMFWFKTHRVRTGEVASLVESLTVLEAVSAISLLVVWSSIKSVVLNCYEMIRLV